jgi:hypothetical protein
VGQPSGCQAQPSQAAPAVELGHAGQARPATFTCELGCAADFWPMTRMENVNPLFFSKISLKLIQTFKIHIKFISCPKIMKSIVLFI